MDDLQTIYRAALPAHIAALESARVEGAEGVARIRRIAHTLRGSGGTYGFPEISTAAGAVEAATGSELEARLQQLIALLRTTAGGT